MSKLSRNEMESSLLEKSDHVIEQLPDCSRMFFRNMRTENKSERSVYQYACDMKGFFEFLKASSGFKNKNIDVLRIDEILDELNREDLQEYIDQVSCCTKKDENGALLRLKSSDRYISRKISSLKSFYSYFYDNKFIKTNPASLIKNPKLSNRNIKILEHSELNRLLDAIYDDSDLTPRQKSAHDRTLKRDAAIMLTLLCTGLRVSELVGIDVDDIDFHNASISVIRKGSDEDEIFFPVEVEEVLLDYINNERDALLSGSNCPALFISSYKERITDRAVQKLIEKYAAKAGIKQKNVTPHMLRRNFGTALYEATGDIFLTANALHHKSVDTTRRHYVRQNREMTRDAVTKLKIIDKY